MALLPFRQSYVKTYSKPILKCAQNVFTIYLTSIAKLALKLCVHQPWALLEKEADPW